MDKIEQQPKLSKAKRRLENIPDMIHHRAIAEKLGIDTETIREWVISGEWPLPHAISGTLFFYRLADYTRWTEGKGWPDGIKFSRTAAETPAV